MARKIERKLRRTQVPLWITISLIALLSAAALALSYLALSGAGSENPEGFPVKTEIQTGLSAAPGEEPPTGSASSEVLGEVVDPSPAPFQFVGEQRLLEMVDSTVAVRAESGTCDNPGTIEFSGDGGQSWNATDSLSTAGATQILRILSAGRSFVQVVALDDSCVPQLYQTANLGGTWMGPLAAGGLWYLNPAEAEKISAPAGLQNLPCAGVALAPAESRAAILCSDGSITMTDDQGISWSAATGVSDVLAVNSAAGSYIAALGADETCGGLHVVSLSNDSLSTPLGCFETSRQPDDLSSSEVALSQAGDFIHLWVGNEYATSTDRGKTWL